VRVDVRETDVIHREMHRRSASPAPVVSLSLPPFLFSFGDSPMAVFFSRDARARLYLPRAVCRRRNFWDRFCKGGHVQQRRWTPRDIHPRARVFHRRFVIEIRSPPREIETLSRESPSLPVESIARNRRSQSRGRFVTASESARYANAETRAIIPVC